MSLFDVIRYQFSLPPTTEELAAVPKEVFDKWANLCFGMGRDNPEIANIGLRRTWDDGYIGKEIVIEYIETMRKCLQELP